MRDYIRQIVEQYLEENIFSSAVQKKQSRGVAQSTGHAVELDMTKPNTNAKVKMAQDSKVVKGLITKGFTHAESSEGGNKVKLYFAGPRQRNTWLKKWRSLDIPAKTKKETNEEIEPGRLGDHTASEIARDATNQRFNPYAKRHNLTPDQISAIRSAVGAKAGKNFKFDRGGGHALAKIIRRSVKARRKAER